MNTLVLLGAGLKEKLVSSVDCWDEDGHTFWSVGQMAMRFPRLEYLIDGMFEMHREEIYFSNATTSKLYKKFLKSPHPYPIFMLKKTREIPASETYPIEQVKERFGSTFFTSTIPYMIAKGLLAEKYKHIKFFGFGYGTDSEYARQLPSIAYWLGRADGQGVSYEFRGDFKYHFDKPMYGYVPWKEYITEDFISNRKSIIRSKKLSAEIKLQMAQNNMSPLFPTVDGINAVMEAARAVSEWRGREQWLNAMESDLAAIDLPRLENDLGSAEARAETAIANANVLEGKVLHAITHRTADVPALINEHKNLVEQAGGEMGIYYEIREWMREARG